MSIKTDVQQNIDQTNPNKKWYIPKNIPTYTPEEIKNLAKDEKDKLEKIKSLPKKVGYYTEITSHKNFYRLSIFDFTPFFIGNMYSIIRLLIAYGDAKKTINFNKKLMWDLKNNLIISMAFSLVFWPLLIITLFLLYPYIVYDSSEVTKGWFAFSDELAINGISSLGTAIKLYIERAILPLLTGSKFLYTILFWFFISFINVQTFLFLFLFRFDRKVLFEIQKNQVREDISKFTKK